MPRTNWSDLEVLLAFGRCGSIGGAARRMRLDATTAARRLSRLEAALGARLVARGAGGRLEPTAAGARAIRRAGAVERELAALVSEAVGADAGTGAVLTLSAVPVLANRLLMPRIGDLLRTHPGVVVALDAENRNLDLARLETDMALRLARPLQGGAQVKARRIGSLAYAAYAAAGAPLEETRDLPWITYRDDRAHLPSAQWLAEAAAGPEASPARVRVGDAEAAVEGVAAGLGRSLLPRLVADADPRLTRIDDAPGAAVREVWLLVRADIATLPATVATAAWCKALLRPQPGGAAMVAMPGN